MNKEDILSAAGGWIKISIKFSGVCVYCKKRLISGEYGYWSKGSKSILHESCYDSLMFPSSANKESPAGNSGSMTLDGAINKNVGMQKKDGSTDNNADQVNMGSISSNGSDVNNSISKSGIVGKRREKKVKCFICNSYVDFNNELVMSLSKLSEGYDSNSDILYCFDCLENQSNNAYENYERKFVNASMDFK